MDQKTKQEERSIANDLTLNTIRMEEFEQQKDPFSFLKNNDPEF